MAAKWEYRVIFIEVSGLEAEAMVAGDLNTHGAEGWELVSIAPTNGRRLIAVFKKLS